MTDHERVVEGVMGEEDPMMRLIASLYNKPATPSFYSPFRTNLGGTGSRFHRWHELTDEQKKKAREQFVERMAELGVAVYLKEW